MKPGKGAAYVRTTLKNYVTGNTMEKTFRAGSKVKFSYILIFSFHIMPEDISIIALKFQVFCSSGARIALICNYFFRLKRQIY